MAVKLIERAFDYETTGLDAYRGARSFSRSLCTPDGVVDIMRKDRVGDAKYRQSIQDFFDDTSIVKICHNFHFELSISLEEGYTIPEDTRWEDTMLMSQIINNLFYSHGLDAVAEHYCPDPETRMEWRRIDQSIEEARRIYGTYDRIPVSLMDPYQYADAERGMLVYLVQKPLLSPAQLADYYNEIELVKETVRMERRGFMLHVPAAITLIKDMEKELAEIPCQVDGRSVNFRSTPQLLDLFYTQKGLPVQKNKKTKKPSADKHALEALRTISADPELHQLIDDILKFRSYSSGITTIKGYIKAAGPDSIIKTHINTNEAGTGRESTTDPSMQNIQKEVGLKTKFSVPARRCFRSRPGYTLDLCDYAGIEMRLAVQATGSARLIRLLEQDYDFHDACARLFYGTRYLDPGEAVKFYLECEHSRQKAYQQLVSELGRDEALEITHKIVKKILRSAAKNGRFAMLYGAGIGQVADTLAISIAEAKAGCARDREEFPEFYSLMTDCMNQVRNTGYIETFFGRKLYVDPSRPYAATDYKIQGSAAGLFKRAQIRVSRWLRKMELDMHPLLPVHDELVFEKHRSLLSRQPEIWAEIGRIMTTMPEITVKLAIEWKQSTFTWDLAKEIK